MRVELHGRTLNALCAIDAVGTGSMYRTDVTIASCCGCCGTGIVIGTADSGRSVRSAMPVETVIWYDLGYSRCAETSNCPAIGFFCSDGDLRRWLAAQVPARLALDEALEVGGALFGPMLASRP